MLKKILYLLLLILITSISREQKFEMIHESKDVNLSQARLNLEKMLNDTNASIEIVDKYENGTARGTRIILKIIVS